jgi:hypothetical protein
VNWFQHNRWLGMFLIIFGVITLASLLFLWRARSDFSEANARFTESLNEQGRLERLDPFPNDANYEKMKVHLNSYSTTLEEMKEEIKTRMLPLTALAPNEFQARLREVTLAAAAKARANKVKLPPSFHLGFDEFTAALPNTTAAPLLGQELSQIALLMDYLIDARVDSLISFRRTPLPEERGATAATPTPKPGPKGAGATAVTPTVVERNVVDLTFLATSAAARKLVNQIASSSQQFFIIRTLYVRNEKEKGPPREESGRAQATPAPNAALTFIVGNEHVQVSARVEMLRFGF